MRAKKKAIELYTIREVADILKVCTRTTYLYTYQKNNPIPVLKLPSGAVRVRKTDLETWLKSNKKKLKVKK
jgi:predicted site-specific integrase-resolvase